MPNMTGGQAVVRALKAEGVEVVFALPGVQIMHIFDAFYDAPEIRLIHCRHEQTTAYMADGYARSTGKVGVCLVVPGPGAYNAGAAMSTAYATSSQVLMVSGQIDSAIIGKDFGALHEIHDQLEFMKPVVKWNDRVMRTEGISTTIHEAMRQMKTGRPRPVEIEIPPDILANTANVDIIEPEVFPRPEPRAASIRAAADLLASARRPVILAGGGAVLADASAELVQLAELLGAPVITTAQGKGAIPDSHPLAMGASAYGWGPGADLMPQADVVLAIGTRFHEPRELSFPQKEGQKLINLNVDEKEIGKTAPATVGIVADARVGLRQLVAALRGRPHSSTWNRATLAATKAGVLDRLGAVAPRQLALVDSIREAIPEDGFVVAGITNIAGWCHAAFPVRHPRTYLTSSYQGNLGFAFPTALGVKVGNPDKAVVSLSGDGGFMYAAAELATAVQHGINVVAVVLNNHRFGASNRDQRGRFHGRVIGTELHNPDFVKLARSFGARGIKAETLDEVPSAIKRALAAKKPTLVEVEMPDLDPLYELQPPKR